MPKQKTKNKPKISFLLLFWGVMGMGIAGMIMLLRVFIIIQQEGIHRAAESNPIILSFEIGFMMIGVILSVFVTYKISKFLLEKMSYE